MRNFASNCLSGCMGKKSNSSKTKQAPSECSDDDVSSKTSREEGLECPICFESFNIVENVPYVLWCGHTLCKNCVQALQWAVVKFPNLPIQLPLFISCPWCNLLSFRLVYKGTLKFPRKNYFLLWMVESMNGDRQKSGSTEGCDLHQSAWSSNNSLRVEQSGLDHDDRNVNNNYLVMERLHLLLTKFLVFFVHLTSKFPLILILLMIILYAIPASAAFLALYLLVTVLFAIPSFLVLYFAYPSLNWLVREIIS